jgi:hypothetical protein
LADRIGWGAKSLGEALQHLRENPQHQDLRADVHALEEALKNGVSGTKNSSDEKSTTSTVLLPGS